MTTHDFKATATHFYELWSKFGIPDEEYRAMLDHAVRQRALRVQDAYTDIQRMHPELGLEPFPFDAYVATVFERYYQRAVPASEPIFAVN